MFMIMLIYMLLGIPFTTNDALVYFANNIFSENIPLFERIIKITCKFVEFYWSAILDSQLSVNMIDILKCYWMLSFILQQNITTNSSCGIHIFCLQLIELLLSKALFKVCQINAFLIPCISKAQNARFYAQKMHIN